jgi:ADP-heptose:LPS heptosyltransferase
LLRPHRDWRSRLRWHLNVRLTRHPRWLEAAGAALTIVDAYEAPGDTLLTAVVCRNLRERFPRLRLNVITAHAELLRHDPHIETLNAPETFFSIWSWYPELTARRDGTTNLLVETFARVGLGRTDFDYRSRVYLTEEERTRARARLGDTPRPVLTFNTRSKEETKNWPEGAWRELLARLRERFHLVQLGDAAEPGFDGVQRLAGALSLRESMAVLSQAQLHVGGVSFLMHAASGLDVPAVIIYGGRETPANSGYTTNENLYAAVECSPCWLHSSLGERCPHAMKCMHAISPTQVLAAAERLLARTK